MLVFGTVLGVALGTLLSGGSSSSTSVPAFAFDALEFSPGENAQ